MSVALTTSYIFSRLAFRLQRFLSIPSQSIHFYTPSPFGYPEKDRVLFRISGKGPGPFSDKLSQLIGGAGKTTFFGGFLPVFCPVLCFFTDSLHMKQIFKKKIGPSLLFLAAGTTDTKFLGSTGVATANSTNKYQKYKSVELGDQLVHFRT